MEVLYEWVWNVAVYLLLVTAVTNVLDVYKRQDLNTLQKRRY